MEEEEFMFGAQKIHFFFYVKKGLLNCRPLNPLPIMNGRANLV